MRPCKCALAVLRRSQEGKGSCGFFLALSLHGEVSYSCQGHARLARSLSAYSRHSIAGVAAIYDTALDSCPP